MSAKLLRSLADNSPDFGEQTGCGHITLKRIPPVYSDFSGSSRRHSLDGFYIGRDLDDKRRASIESPRASYSSACSSSFSSLDSAPMHQVEAPILDRSMNRSFRREKPIQRPAELKESLRVLAKLREAPSSYFGEQSEVSRSYYEAAYLAPRHSYDGKLLSEPQETVSKLKDCPRLSLVSRERAMESSHVLEDSRNWTSQVKRPPNLVAKLMGLETLPDLVRPIGASDSSCRRSMGSGSPSWKLDDAEAKTVLSSRFLIDSAPWKQQQKGRNWESKSSGSEKDKVAAAQCSSVHSEIGTKSKDIESEQSEKDLGALKQILEAMRAKGLLETQISEEKCEAKLEQKPDDSRNIEPTIVVMKPARLLGNNSSGKRGQARGDLIPKEPSVISPVKSSSSVSRSRLPKKKVDSEKQELPNKQPHERKIMLVEKPGSDLPKFSSLKCSRQRKMGPVQTTRRRVEEDGSPHLVQHLSPTSVLDVVESTDDSPSPVKETTQGSVEAETAASTEIDRTKLQDVERLVQKLKRLSGENEEKTTDYVALLCENPNPDRRYISEILVASGLLLRDLSSGLSALQLHSSGNPMNPGLFLVLEQRKARNFEVTREEKSSRRLIFDAVNENLKRKVDDSRAIVRDKLVAETLTARKLLRELCSEIELLEAKVKKQRSGSEGEADVDAGCLRSILLEDVMRREDRHWTDPRGTKTYEVVTHIEGMIFKELVDEVEVGGKVGF